MDNISLADVFTPQRSWDYFLYAIMFFQLILLVILFATESLRDTIMIAAVVLCAFADKAYLFGYIEGGRETLAGAVQFHAQKAFGTFAIRVAMFAIPLVLVTQTKVKSARPLAILLFLMTLIYTFGRWAFEQRIGEDAWQDSSGSLTSPLLHANAITVLVSAWWVRHKSSTTTLEIADY